MSTTINAPHRLSPEERRAAGAAADAVRCFRLIAYVGQRLRYLLDQRLREDGLTTQQGFLLTVVSTLGQPTLGEVAKAMSMSHQNAKQVAMALERKGMLCVLADNDDRRAKRLIATSTSSARWHRRNEADFAAVGAWFAALPLREQQQLASMLEKLARHLGEQS